MTMPNILIVDDRRENLIALHALLDDCDACIFQSESGQQALECLLERDYALVLLDVQMPDMDGFEVAQLMRGNQATRHIPIVFVTAISKEAQYVFKGYESGAIDYLSKPLDPVMLRSKVNVFLELWRQKDQLGRTVVALQEANQRIEEQNRALQELAIRDHLTGLYQRRWFDDMAEREWCRAQRNGTALSLAILDIDHFKQINDRYGHPAGDSNLVQLAEILLDSVRSGDEVFRFGGEEFVILMPLTKLPQALSICERIRAAVEAQPFHHAEGTHVVTLSIGVAEYVEAISGGMHALLELADKRLYLAKHQGRNRVCGCPQGDRGVLS
jgi:diguanylate cyclase (GGDEF)-like protein